eukprot:8672908-Alexandrium_andersonii.AAC.1
MSRLDEVKNASSVCVCCNSLPSKCEGLELLIPRRCSRRERVQVDALGVLELVPPVPLPGGPRVQE